MGKIYLFLSVLCAGVFFSFTKSETKYFPVVQNTKPDTLSWKLLSQVKYLKKPDEEYGEIMWPIINTQLKKTNGKRIVMSGFVVPIDNTSYALSKNVFASCFFCGKAGPETIMGIKFRDKKTRIKTDTYVMLEGKFRVNDKNAEDWMYHIEDAVVVKKGK